MHSAATMGLWRSYQSVLDRKAGSPRTGVNAVKLKGTSGVKSRCVLEQGSSRSNHMEIEKQQKKKREREKGEGEVEGRETLTAPTSTMDTVDPGLKQTQKLEKNNR